MNNTIRLSNGKEMPFLFQGLPLIMGLKSIGRNQFEEIVANSMSNGIHGFDTSHDYGKSEDYLGSSFQELMKKGINRDDFFVVTKIGNAQQYEGHIEDCVELSLKTLQLDYIDLVLLHWPVPDHFIPNWKKLEKVYESGKVGSIGIANARVRHLKQLLDSDINEKPHIVQTEIHPFNSCEEIRTYCKQQDIALQSCSSLCLMIDKVKKNPLLNRMASKYEKSVAQVMLRWLIQLNIAPIFRAFNEKHIVEMRELFNFNITKEDIDRISSLNENYRFHPESLNCAGF